MSKADKFVNKLIGKFNEIDKEIMKEKIQEFADKHSPKPYNKAAEIVMREEFESDLTELIKEAQGTIRCGRFTISEYPPIPENDTNNSKNVIYMGTSEGEGTTIDLEELFEWAM